MWFEFSKSVFLLLAFSPASGTGHDNVILWCVALGPPLLCSPTLFLAGGVWVCDTHPWMVVALSSFIANSRALLPPEKASPPSGHFMVYFIKATL